MKTCCGLESVFVDNVPGKEYWYCRECKKEVLQQKTDSYGIENLDVGMIYNCVNTYNLEPVVVIAVNRQTGYITMQTVRQFKKLVGAK